MPSLAGRCAIVTGGNKGIGRAIALRFAREGARVAIGARDRRASDAVVAEIRAGGGDALALDLDVADEAQVEAAFKMLDSQWGVLHILVNNAGIGHLGTTIAETSTADWDRIHGVNLRGAFFCARAAFPRIARSGGGTIVNISSVLGKQAWAGTGAYAASKFGLIALTQTLADEGEAVGIKASAICPGMVKTEMTAGFGLPDEEKLAPEDVADAAMYLVTLGSHVKVPEIVLNRKGAD